MRFDIDLSKVPSLKAPPEGIYLIRIVGCEVKDTKTGNKKLTYEANILAPQEIASHPDYQRFWFDMPLVEKAQFRLRDMYDDGFGLLAQVEASGGFDTGDLIGLEAGCKLSQRAFEGVIRPNVDRWYRADQVEPEVTGSMENPTPSGSDSGSEANISLPG